MPYAPNLGERPPECAILGADGEPTGYRRVHVRLFGGWDSKKAGHAPWPSDGGTSWRIGRKPHPFEIQEYEVV